MATSGYRRHDIRRCCDICGHQWFMSELKYIGQNRWACKDDSPGMTAEAISRHNAKVKPLIVKSARHPRPASFSGEYLFSEERVFRLVLDYATTAAIVGPTGKIITVANQTSAAWSAIYLASMIQEGERPAAWLTQARTKLAAICTYLRSLQYGDATGPSPSETITSLLYGHVTASSTSVSPASTAIAGIAFVRAYLILGDAALLTAANMCAHALRNAQRVDMAAGVHYLTYPGGWPSSINISTKGPTSFMFNDAAVGVWFLRELRPVVGGSAVIGSTTVAGDFASAPSATLDVTVADAVAFYFTGKVTNGSATTVAVAGAVVAQVSSTTPADQYSQMVSDGGGTGTFTLTSSTSLAADRFCLALRSLFEYEGYTARVKTIFEWLMGFVAPNATQEFDPLVALTDTLQVKASSAVPSTPVQYAGTVYAMGTAGLLAPLYIASGRTLRTCKDEMATARYRNSGAELGRATWWSSLAAVMTAGYVLPSLAGGIGKHRTLATDRKQLLSGSTNGAPVAGMVYRYAPKAHAPVPA